MSNRGEIETVKRAFTVAKIIQQIYHQKPKGYSVYGYTEFGYGINPLYNQTKNNHIIIEGDGGRYLIGKYIHTPYGRLTISSGGGGLYPDSFSEVSRLILASPRMKLQLLCSNYSNQFGG